jgi:hypothetical protein
VSGTPQGVEVGPDGQARVWTQLTVKINLGPYESAEVSTGTSIPVDNTPTAIRAALKKLHRRHVVVLGEALTQAREDWGTEG